jgi:hypothetical protein
LDLLLLTNYLDVLTAVGGNSKRAVDSSIEQCNGIETKLKKRRRQLSIANIIVFVTPASTNFPNKRSYIQTLC